MTSTTVQGLATALVAVLLVGASAGCAGTGDARPATPTPTPTQDAAMDEIPDLGPDAVGIAADVNAGTCATKKGAAVARGTVQNAGPEPRDVVVVVTWLGAQGRPLSVKVFHQQKLDTGSRATYELATTLPEDAARCVVTGRVAG